MKIVKNNNKKSSLLKINFSTKTTSYKSMHEQQHPVKSQKSS